MKKEILLKIHKSYRWVVAICDKDLVGKKFTEENRQIDLTGNFFRGELMSEEKLKSEIKRCLKEDATFNIVGKKSVELAEKMELASVENILEVDGVPFVLVLL